jgi:riboflavin biosynthesis pyrimidine reductase
LGVANLLVEGGSKIISSFILEKLCDELLLFQSNFFIGNNGATILRSKDLSLFKNKFKLKKTMSLNNNILSIFEN